MPLAEGDYLGFGVSSGSVVRSARPSRVICQSFIHCGKGTTFEFVEGAAGNPELARGVGFRERGHDRL